MTTRSLDEAQSDLSRLVRYVQDSQDRVTLTHEGKALAILMSVQELESLEETVAVLSEPGALGEIIEAREAMASENVCSASEVLLRKSTAQG
jgi:prevent-host-death family protein